MVVELLLLPPPAASVCSHPLLNAAEPAHYHHQLLLTLLLQLTLHPQGQQSTHGPCLLQLVLNFSLHALLC